MVSPISSQIAMIRQKAPGIATSGELIRENRTSVSGRPRYKVCTLRSPYAPTRAPPLSPSLTGFTDLTGKVRARRTWCTAFCNLLFRSGRG